MTYLIAGGSSGLGRALAERFAMAGCELVLLSRDTRDTRALAQHLKIKYGVKVSAAAVDLGNETPDYDAIDHALVAHGPLRGLLLPIGANDEADVVGLNDEKLEALVRTNFLSPCKLINRYLARLEENDGVVVGFGSVATARGRSRNAAYAAAKNALQIYFESLAHYAAERHLSCQYYVLGYLESNLSFAQDLLFPLASPERLADIVYRSLHRRGRRFLPRLWYFVYHIVKLLPWTLFKRLSF